MRRRGRTIAFSTVALGVVVLVAAGIAAKDKVLERWYLRALASNDLMEKKGAAEKLGRMGSVDAIPLLVNLIREDHEVRDTFKLTQCYLGVNSTTVVFPILHPLSVWPRYWPGQVLVQIGRPSIPPLMCRWDEKLARNGEFWVTLGIAEPKQKRSCHLMP